MELKPYTWTLDPHRPPYGSPPVEAPVNGRVMMTFGIVAPSLPSAEAMERVQRVMAASLKLHQLLLEAVEDREGWRVRASEALRDIGPTDGIP